MNLRSWTLRKWVIAVFGVIGVGLVPWTIWLSTSLKPDHVTQHWNLAWSGFDLALAFAFLATAYSAWRKSPWVGTSAAATGTLLVTDAWFDIVLESQSADVRNAVVLAVFAELPIAAVCFWIAYRTEHFLSLLLEEPLHLAPTAERAAQSDLVGVLEIPPDGEPTGEPRDPNSTA